MHAAQLCERHYMKSLRLLQRIPIKEDYWNSLAADLAPFSVHTELNAVK